MSRSEEISRLVSMGARCLWIFFGLGLGLQDNAFSAEWEKWESASGLSCRRLCHLASPLSRLRARYQQKNLHSATNGSGSWGTWAE